MKRSLLALISLSMVLLSCGDDGSKPDHVATNGCEISFYGQGVYYFACTQRFGAALAEFRKTHEVVSATSFAIGNLGTSGYYVVVGR